MSKPFDATHHITIDPSQRSSAIAILPADGRVIDALVEKVGGVEEIGGYGPLRALSAAVECRPLVMIECPDWSGYGTKEVRAAVNAWERHLKSLFPKRRVMRVKPKDWQFALYGSRRARMHSDAKENSLFYTRVILHRDFGKEDDLSDALCLMAYLRSWLKVPQ